MAIVCGSASASASSSSDSPIVAEQHHDRPATWNGRELTSDERRLMHNLAATRARVKQIHWRARQPARRLTAPERQEIQARLYATKSPPRQTAKSHLHSSVSHASAISAMATTAEKAAAADPSPSEIAAAAARSAARTARTSGGAVLGNEEQSPKPRPRRARAAATSRAAGAARASRHTDTASSSSLGRLPQGWKQALVRVRESAMPKSASLS